MLLVSIVPVALLARQGEPPPSRTLSVGPASDVPAVELAAVDVAEELALDALKSRDLERPPLRFAVPIEVSITPWTAGRWQRLADGSRLWRLRIHVPGATDLNFGFTRFRLPARASLYVVSETEDYYEGPYTHRDNEDHGELWTPLVPGDQARIELFLPAGQTGEPELELTRVGGGYRDLFRRHGGPKQGSCNVDVVCPEGDLWRDEIRSVARYSINGIGLCTGTLIMDVPGSFRPFFLSAAHCQVTPQNAASVVVYWDYESPSCGQLGGGSLAHNQTGATFRASHSDVDMALLELDDTPNPPLGVFFAGWDRSGYTPDGSVGIHHPNGDEKAISFNTDPLSTIDSCIGGGGANTHWQVDDWELGTTEPGSSGSGLWDLFTHRLVGFLSGGDASCSFPGSDCYGKFWVAWNAGGSAASRLRDWLDPQGQGDLTVDGSYAPPTACQVDFSLGCGAVDSYRNDGLGSTDNVDSYPCVPGANHAGPEYTYSYRAATSGSVKVSLTGLSADLDLLVLQDSGTGCQPDSCLGSSTQGGTSSELVRFQAVAGRTYYIVVDGYEGAVSNYSISFSCAGFIFGDGFESGDLSAWSRKISSPAPPNPAARDFSGHRSNDP